MASRRLKTSKSPCFISWEDFRNQNLPTDSADEASLRPEIEYFARIVACAARLMTSFPGEWLHHLEHDMCGRLRDCKSRFS
jgi:hypothetical protein